jgi:hypothetical protein
LGDNRFVIEIAIAIEIEIAIEIAIEIVIESIPIPISIVGSIDAKTCLDPSLRDCVFLGVAENLP